MGHPGSPARPERDSPNPSLVRSETPADRAAVLPAAGQESSFEPACSNRSGSASIHIKKALVDQVSEGNMPIMSPAVVCLPMRAFQTRQGVLYAQIVDTRTSFDRHHLEVLMGIAAVAAIAIEHAAQVEVLKSETGYCGRMRMRAIRWSPAVRFWPR